MSRKQSKSRLSVTPGKKGTTNAIDGNTSLEISHREPRLFDERLKIPGDAQCRTNPPLCSYLYCRFTHRRVFHFFLSLSLLFSFLETSCLSSFTTWEFLFDFFLISLTLPNLMAFVLRMVKFTA